MDQSSPGDDSPVHSHGGCSNPAQSQNVNRKTFAFCPNCGSKTVRRVEFGKSRPACPQCGWIGFNDPKVAAAVLIEQAGRVLLVKRLNEPGQGLWSLPAGYIDAGEDPAEAAARECLEETGLEVRISALLDVISGKENGRGADITILYRAEVTGGAVKPGDDAEAVEFFTRGHLPPLAFKSTRVVLGLENGNYFIPE